MQRRSFLTKASLGGLAAGVSALAAPVADGTAWDPTAQVTAVPGGPVIALAGGPAFSFGYAEHEELLETLAAGDLPAMLERLERHVRAAAGALLG